MAAPLSYQSTEVLPSGLDTGWFPKCPSGDHCPDYDLQARVQFQWNPINPGDALYSISMGQGAKVSAKLDGTTATLSLPAGGVDAGVFDVMYSITPTITLYLDVANYTGEFAVDRPTLESLIPNGQYNYYAVNHMKFTPWAFDKLSAKVAGNDLAAGQLFNIELSDLGKMTGAGGDVTLAGFFALYAGSDLTFAYQTTELAFPGTAGPITTASGTTTLSDPGAYPLSLTANVKAELTYGGTLNVLPMFQITSVNGVAMQLSFPTTTGEQFTLPSKTVPLTFPAAQVTLPNPCE